MKRNRALTLLPALLLGGTLFGAALPNLPNAIAFPQGKESPGVVTFRHESHVDAARPDCTSCHPKLFEILRSSAPATAILHSDMEKGRACGACHDGKKAFAPEDCTACHTAG
jgi:c(7)-type cytochrome triheme protein